MSRQIALQPLSAEAFAPFGDVIDCAGDPDKIINEGLCGRYHNRANVDVMEGSAGISLFKAQVRALPLSLRMVERHPLCSQAFLPMYLEPFAVIVCPDEAGKPGRPRAFLTGAGQGVNYHRNTWHGVLTPLAEPGQFAVIDSIGDRPNLEEFWFDDPWIIVPQ